MRDIVFVQSLSLGFSVGPDVHSEGRLDLLFPVVLSAVVEHHLLDCYGLALGLRLSCLRPLECDLSAFLIVIEVIIDAGGWYVDSHEGLGRHIGLLKRLFHHPVLLGSRDFLGMEASLSNLHRRLFNA